MTNSITDTAQLDEGIERLERVWDEITEHPELHNQQAYAISTPCGTAHCTAGWLAVHAGWAISMYGNWIDPAGKPETHSGLLAAARDLIGIGPAVEDRQVSWDRLFDSDLSPAEIRAGIDAYRVEAGLAPRVFEADHA